eukprot:1678730-Amphidinium_carterae.3
MGNNLPYAEVGLQGVVAVNAGDYHACIIQSEGTTQCWGRGGLLGLGDTADRGTLKDSMGDKLPAIDLGSSFSSAGGGPTFTTACSGAKSLALFDLQCNRSGL